MRLFSRICFSILPLLCISFGNQACADIDSTREVLRSFSEGRSEVTEAYDQLASTWKDYSDRYQDHWDIDKLLAAVEFAAEKHEGQIRKDADATPYIIHPIGVARLLWDIGEVRSINVLIGALLHDTLEDTSASESEIEELFGSRVLYEVKEVTNDPSLDSQENKQRQVDHAPAMSLDGQLVKLADRLYNVLDLEKTPPPSWSQEKIDDYRLWGQKLLNALRGTNQRLEDALEAQVTKESDGSIVVNDAIVGFHKVTLMRFEWDRYEGNYLECIYYYLDDHTIWSVSYFENLRPLEGDTVEIVPVQNDEPEYMEGKRYWMVGTTIDREVTKVAFYPGRSSTEFYSGYPFSLPS